MKIDFEISKKQIAVVVTLLLLTNMVSWVVWSNAGFEVGLKRGSETAYETALNEVVNLFETSDSGVKFSYSKNGDGSYRFQILTESEGTYSWNIPVTVELHLLVEHFRDGVLLSSTYHPMNVTNFGANWMADKISGASSTNFMANATWIGVSNDSSAVSLSWTTIPNEITTDGLSRAEGTVADTGTGTWNVTKSFSVTGTNSTKLYGLYLDAYNGATLVAAEQQGTGNQKNVGNGDTLQVTVQGTVSAG